MKPALVDVPVLILFFNRPQQLSQVFEQVKNIYRRNGLSQKSTNALYWKMMMCRQSLSSVSARKCWTSTNMTPASA